VLALSAPPYYVVGMESLLTVEPIDCILALAASNSTVNALVLVSLKLQEILQDVQHFRHLHHRARIAFRLTFNTANTTATTPGFCVIIPLLRVFKGLLWMAGDALPTQPN